MWVATRCVKTTCSSMAHCVHSPCEAMSRICQNATLYSNSGLSKNRVTSTFNNADQNSLVTLESPFSGVRDDLAIKDTFTSHGVSEVVRVGLHDSVPLFLYTFVDKNVANSYLLQECKKSCGWRNAVKMLRGYYISASGKYYCYLFFVNLSILSITWKLQRWYGIYPRHVIICMMTPIAWS